jgi:hypothetical protein
MSGRLKFVCLLLALLSVHCSSAEPDARRRPGFVGGAGSGPTGNGQPGVAPVGGLDNGSSNVLPPAAAPPMENPGRCNQDVDVVFSLDITGSMIPPLTTLEEQVGIVDAALQTKNLPSPPHYGIVIFSDDFLLANDGMPFIDILDVEDYLYEQIQKTNDMPPRQVDDALEPNNLSWPENSMDALYEAATKFQWRPVDKTLRTIIHITDASFWDKNVSSSGHETEAPRQGVPGDSSMHGYEEVIAALRSQKIWVNTFTAKTGGPPDGNMSPPSHGQWRGTAVNVGKGWTEPYKGLPTVAMSTGGFALDIDDVFDKKITMADPINQAIENHQCAVYPLN